MLQPSYSVGFLSAIAQLLLRHATAQGGLPLAISLLHLWDLPLPVSEKREPVTA